MTAGIPREVSRSGQAGGKQNLIQQHHSMHTHTHTHSTPRALTHLLSHTDFGAAGAAHPKMQHKPWDCCPQAAPAQPGECRGESQPSPTAVLDSAQPGAPGTALSNPGSSLCYYPAVLRSNSGASCALPLPPPRYPATHITDLGNYAPKSSRRVGREREWRKSKENPNLTQFSQLLSQGEETRRAMKQKSRSKETLLNPRTS